MRSGRAGATSDGGRDAATASAREPGRRRRRWRCRRRARAWPASHRTDDDRRRASRRPSTADGGLDPHPGRRGRGRPRPARAPAAPSAAAAGPRSGSASAASAEQHEASTTRTATARRTTSPAPCSGVATPASPAGSAAGANDAARPRPAGRAGRARGTAPSASAVARQQHGASGERRAIAASPATCSAGVARDQPGEPSADAEPAQQPLDHAGAGPVDAVGDGVPAAVASAGSARGRRAAARQSAQATRWASIDDAVTSSTAPGRRRTGRAASAGACQSCRSCQCSSELGAGPHHAGLDGAGRDAEQVAGLAGGQPVEHGGLDDGPQLGRQVRAAPRPGRRARRRAAPGPRRPPRSSGSRRSPRPPVGSSDPASAARR